MTKIKWPKEVTAAKNKLIKIEAGRKKINVASNKQQTVVRESMKKHVAYLNKLEAAGKKKGDVHPVYTAYITNYTYMPSTSLRTEYVVVGQTAKSVRDAGFGYAPSRWGDIRTAEKVAYFVLNPKPEPKKNSLVNDLARIAKKHGLKLVPDNK